MAATAEQLYRDALKLPVDERAELTERLVGSLAQDVPAEVARAQMEEVRRRIAEVESGSVAVIPGDEALAQVRRLLLGRSSKAGQ